MADRKEPRVQHSFGVFLLLFMAAGSAFGHAGHGAPAVHAHPPGAGDPLALLAIVVLVVIVVAALGWALRSWKDRAP